LCLGEPDVAASVPQSNVDAGAAASVSASDDDGDDDDDDDDNDGELSVMSDVVHRDIKSDAVEFDVMSDSVHQQPLIDTTNSIVIIGELFDQKHLFVTAFYVVTKQRHTDM